MRFGRRVTRRLREQGGYTLVEMLTVLLILGVVMGGLTSVFVTATNADADMNNRFRAQQTARLALDKLRREVHCSSAATPAGSATSSITLTLPTYCKTYSGSTSVTWCTRSVATNRYALYRVDGATCTGGVKWADNLTPTATAPVCSGALCIFNYSAQSTSSLAKLQVDFPVNPKASRTVDTYELIDGLVLRNSTRS
ncbi:MAG: prepilin-type N-terminal cleavage/methylation domain-containing protein [Actinobacteria bacterium]|nr:MAG: prepilin-type N-terminal cleavage/methylation domain-containing protein [Actinomycetota bacterium]TMM26955.1 MAG: prepilin-type N-terminal cleavage/methylation domain-containing protein [Actinomycetota bacterium]